MKLGIFVLVAVLAGCAGADEKPLPETGEPRLAYVRNVKGDTDLYVIGRPPGGLQTNLTRTPRTEERSHDDGGPSWSPDGTRLAYVTSADHRSGGWQTSEIAVVGADGGEARVLTDDDQPDVAPHWTSDGRIAFTHCDLTRDGLPRCRLETIGADGGDRRTEVDGLGMALGVRLTPVGEAIAFSRYDRTLSGTVVIRDRGSGEEQQLGPGDGPVWSPDGSQLAFTSGRDENGRCLFHDCVGSAPELYVVDADGGNVRRLTRTLASEMAPSWTPDGDWILLSRIADENGDHDLHAVRADGTCERQLTETPVWELSPAWIGPTGSLSC